MSRLKEFKDRAKFILDEVESSYELRSYYEDLVDDLLLELQRWEHQSYILEKDISDEYYPKITKDPTIIWYETKTGNVRETYSIKNPNFLKLKELGLYSLSSDSNYLIRTQEQIDYLSQFVDFDLDNYYYCINFD